MKQYRNIHLNKNFVKLTNVISSDDIKISKITNKSLANRKKIFINEINSRKDYIIEDSYMDVMNCDEPNPYFPSLFLLIKYEKQFVFKDSIIKIS